MDSIKQEIEQCEKEIADIKGALRNLGMPRDDEATENVLRVVLYQTEGLPEGADPQLALQLSSPIEEATIRKVYDESNKDESTMVATFKGVQVNQATLTITAKDADIPLGSSAAVDLKSALSIDAIQQSMQKEYTAEVALPIKVEEGDDDAAVVCTIHLRLTLEPSPKELREMLYESLNQTSQRKAAALQKLRQLAMESNRQAITKNKDPAVKAGFLNKNKGATKSKLTQFYEKWLGPQSMVRQIYPIAKNYVMFAVVVGFSHFKGHLLALPPPV